MTLDAAFSSILSIARQCTSDTTMDQIRQEFAELELAIQAKHVHPEPRELLDLALAVVRRFAAQSEYDIERAVKGWLEDHAEAQP